LLALVLCVLAVLTSLVLAHRLSAPIVALQAATRQIAGGRYDVEVPRVTSGDELGDLAHDFGVMTRTLRATIADLAAREEKYRTILESIEEGYYEVDLAGNITFCNDALGAISGYPRAELVGKNNRAYMDPETARHVYQVFNDVYRSGEPVRAFRYEVIRKDAERRFLEGSVSLVRDATGAPVGFRGIVRDVTERQRAEAVRTQLI